MTQMSDKCLLSKSEKTLALTHGLNHMGKAMFTPPSLEPSLLQTSLQFASPSPYSLLQAQFQFTILDQFLEYSHTYYYLLVTCTDLNVFMLEC